MRRGGIPSPAFPVETISYVLGANLAVNILILLCLLVQLTRS